MVITGKGVKAEFLINNWVADNLSFAVFRLPGKSSFQVFFSQKGFTEIEKIEFGNLPPGFAFAPYNKIRNPLFIESEYKWEAETDNPVLDGPYPFEEFKNTSGSSFDVNLDRQSVNNKNVYFDELNKVISRIKSGEARKVVLSRKKYLGELKGSNYFLGFINLCNAYPDAMVSLVHLGHLNQLWYGASPELLVSNDENQIFRTISLAATQSAYDKSGNEINPVDALWTSKEIEEQALVGRYIINCFKKIRVREFDEIGPKTVKAGNLLHLRTDYNINNKDVKFPDLSSVMLELLHPTPAICGSPKEAAHKIISETEAYDREFYCGFLGPVNQDSESCLYVNLRTMKIENNKIYVFAGGGVLEDSKPEKEWHETEIKMQTVAKAFTNC